MIDFDKVMDKNLDIQIVEALKVYLASDVEDKVASQKLHLYSIVSFSQNASFNTSNE